ncbi:DUF5615 family PIN-like protein [Microcystis aeruginosa]|uniref:DUF5615 family PIN-like protein n=2 Tax=Microcystis aeruginosa TaxID=1126 RepID=UPI0035D4C3B0
MFDDVLTINKIGLTGCTDDVVLDYAIQENRILLTHNCDDFEELHQANPSHSGILAVYRNANRFKTHIPHPQLSHKLSPSRDLSKNT